MFGQSREGITDVTFDLDFEDCLEREEKWIMETLCETHSLFKKARGFKRLKKIVQGHLEKRGAKLSLHKIIKYLKGWDKHLRSFLGNA